LFHSARWKAYLQDIQDNPDDEKSIDNIYRSLHSQKLFFTVDEKNSHQKDAEEALKRSDDLMKDCTDRVDALEETLAHTPKPSEMLNWDTMTLQDLT
jgi:DNA polymerase III alpha subunit